MIKVFKPTNERTYLLNCGCAYENTSECGIFSAVRLNAVRAANNPAKPCRLISLYDFLVLKFRILITTELIEFSLRGKYHIGLCVVLGYFLFKSNSWNGLAIFLPLSFYPLCALSPQIQRAQPLVLNIRKGKISL